MGAGGGNYAQAAMQTLFNERLKQMGNQPAKAAEVNQELVDEYSKGLSSLTPSVETSETMPESKRLLRIREAIKEKEKELADKKEGSSAYNILEKTIDGLKRTAELEEKYARPQTQFSYSAPDILAAYTTGDFSKIRKGATSGLEGIQKSLDEKQKALDELMTTTTSTRMVPQYEMTTPSPTYGIAGGSAPKREIVSGLPKDAQLVQGQYGQQFYQAPMQFTQMGQQNTNPTYRQVGSKKVTTTSERPAEAGDKEYDKQKRIIDALQAEYDRRNKYATTPANTQNLVGQPVVNQPQTMYNINDILKRYIG